MLLTVLQATQPIPASAYVLCFIPLAAVVIGLVVLFVLTDRHASRPYARYNPFVAATAAPGELEARPPVVGETPAGPLGASPPGTTTVFEGAAGAVRQVPKGEAPPPAASDTPASFSGRPGPAAPESLGMLTQEAQEALSVPTRTTAEGAGSQSLAPAGVMTSVGVTIAHIEYKRVGDSWEGEYVRIINTSASPVTMTGWRLEDEGAKHTYIFPTFTLAPGAEVRLWSLSGVDDAANLYWGHRQPIWNDTGDTATLYDASGKEVSRFSYGPSGPDRDV